MKLTGTDRQRTDGQRTDRKMTDGQDNVLSQADTLTKKILVQHFFGAQQIFGSNNWG